MSRLAVEKTATAPTTNLDSSYNSSKWNLGSLIKQRLDLNPPFIGPIVNAVTRPAEVGAGVANSATYPWVMQWDVSNGMDWVFLMDNNAAATKRLHLYEFNRNNSQFTWKGYTVLTFPQVGAHTTVGFRMTYDTYSKGQVTGLGNVIHGWQSSPSSSTAWINDGLCVGSRIGFGSTDPTQISPANWYTIAFISKDTSIHLTANLTAPISVSTNYVIEDLRALHYSTSATLVNSGLYVAKGLNHVDFTPGGTVCVSCNTVVDSSKFVYRLASVNTTTAINTIDVSGCGLCIEPKSSWQSQFAYGLHLHGPSATQNLRIFKYNVRAPLTILPGLGTSISAVSASTGVATVSTATVSRTNNGRFVKAKHGPLADVSALYFVTLTRLNAIKTEDVIEGSTTFIDSEMQEKPPGSVNTFAATAALTGLEYSTTMDRFLLMTSGATAFRSYVTQYRTDLGPMDHIFLVDDKQIDQSLVDSNTTPHISTLSLYQAPWVEGGMLYTTGTGTTAVTNIMHATPIGVEWTYSSSTNADGRLISPKFLTPNCNKFVRVYAVRDNMLGNDIIGKRTDAMRVWYRTSGIDDNSGSWTLVAEPNDLSAASAEQIQFMVEFKGITDFCVPARLMVLGVVYDDTATDSHFRLSQVNSNVTTKTFAWRFVNTFDASVPALKVRLIDDVSDAPLVTDYTDTSTGTWQKSYNDGANWIAYDSADKGNETTYIRYTPTALADNTKVRAVLTQR